MATIVREAFRAALKAILDAVDLGVDVLERMPYEGAPLRSVVFTVISGSSRHGALGDRTELETRALEEVYRLQVDCYHDDQVECGKLANAVEQALMDHMADLESTYDIHDLKKVNDFDASPADPTARESRIPMDFMFYTHRTLA